jgi:hypothetical protein
MLLSEELDAVRLRFDQSLLELLASFEADRTSFLENAVFTNRSRAVVDFEQSVARARISGVLGIG